MKDKVLYFPQIGLPDSSWATRMLLYWDSVGSIVPSEFVERPEDLDEYSRDLVRRGLLTQIVPGWYVHAVPRFEEAFLAYLDSLGAPEIDRRRRLLETSSSGGLVHTEKLDSLGHQLKRMGLAKRKNSAWYCVDDSTAEDFMFYLAAVLGQLPDLEFIPVTDRAAHLRRFLSRSTDAELDAERRLDPLRLEVLQSLLPAPERTLAAKEIEIFKRKHGELMRAFRRRVELELLQVADIVNPALRKRRLEIFVEGAQEEIDEIRLAMKSARLGNLIFGGVFAVGAAIPGVPGLVGLAAAVYQAFSPPRHPIGHPPLLYAAYAQDELLKARA